jgi:hypothetical protein
MISIDKTELIMEAYHLYKSGFEWKIYSEADIEYLAQNTIENNAVLPFEEVFFGNFTLEKQSNYDNEVVMNQGDLLEWFHKNTVLKPTKYELKEIFTKNKMTYSAHRIGGILKKGFKLYKTLSDNPY